MPVAPSTSPDAYNVAGLSRLAGGLVAVTFGLLVVGASVRVHGAGLACPDWPLCFGEIIPTVDFGVAFEFGHRVLAGLVSLGFVVLLGGMFRARRALPTSLAVLSGIALVSLAIQVVLGGLTVLELLAQWTVTSHLLVGNTFCLFLLLIAMGLAEVQRPARRAPVSAMARASAGGFALLLLLQLVLGGLVSSSHAGLVCGPLWPECTAGAWFPTFDGLIGLHLAHRTIAYGLLIGASALWLGCRGVPRVRTAATSVLVFVWLQAAIGVANVLGSLPVEVTLLHTAGAAALVLSVTWLQRELWLSPLSARNAVRDLALGAA